MRFQPLLLSVMPLMVPVLGLRAGTPNVVYRTDWPQIRKFTFQTKIDTRSEKIFFAIPIFGTKGQILYTFACHGGSEKYLDSLEKSLGECIVSPMCFFLGEGATNTTGPLLGEDGVASWHTRGQVRFDELVGDCGKYPEFGRVRHFKVRGMKIKVEFKNVEIDRNGMPVFLDLEVSGIPDPTATSSWSERPGYLHPEGNCKDVRKGREPLMFRNESGSWAEDKQSQLPPKHLVPRSMPDLNRN